MTTDSLRPRWQGRAGDGRQPGARVRAWRSRSPGPAQTSSSRAAPCPRSTASAARSRSWAAARSPSQLDVREQESITRGGRRRGHAGGPRRHPRQQRRLQRAQAGARGELGRLEPRPRHEPAWRVLRLAGACSGDDRARVGPDRQHRLAHERLRLRRSRPVHGEPRRHPPAHDEPRRRVGRARRHRQLPCPWLVPHGAERRHVPRRGVGRIAPSSEFRWAGPGRRTTWRVRSSSSPPTRARTSPDRRCSSTGASRPAPRGRPSLALAPDRMGSKVRPDDAPWTMRSARGFGADLLVGRATGVSSGGSRSPSGLPMARSVPSTVALVAALAAAVSGWGVVHHGRQMIHEGVTVEDGGGWVALLLTEFMVSFSASCVAIYHH